jgi:Tol biopolymer transport system component
MKKVLQIILIVSSCHLGKCLPPGITTSNNVVAPALVGAGIISTEDDEYGQTFSPDGKTCFFTKRSPSTLWSNVIVICYSVWKNGTWSEPEIAPFSGKYKDFNPTLSPDGSKLFFISNRTDSVKKTPDTDIWMVTKTAGGWSAPMNVGAPVNSAGWEWDCSVARDGTLYFSSTGSNGNFDLYCSRWIDGKYQPPERLSEVINSPNNESDPFIAEDESFLLFSSQGRDDTTPAGEGASAGYPRSDLYISFRKNGQWTPAQNLGPTVNSPAEESSPSVSHDGKTFYFTSERNFISLPMKTPLTYLFLEKHLRSTGNGLGDIYEIPFNEVIGKLK